MEIQSLVQQAKIIVSERLLKLSEKYPDKNWNHKMIVFSENMPIEIIEKYPNKPWVWGEFGLSNNPNITIEVIEKHLEKKWNWKELSLNPNLTIRID